MKEGRIVRPLLFSIDGIVGAATADRDPRLRGVEKRVGRDPYPDLGGDLLLLLQEGRQSALQPGGAIGMDDVFASRTINGFDSLG